MARDPGDEMARALMQSAVANGVTLTITVARSVRWASATFSGARHELAMTAIDTPALAAWLAMVPEQEFAIRGQLVADLVVDRIERGDGTAAITFAALTVEEC